MVVKDPITWFFIGAGISVIVLVTYYNINNTSLMQSNFGALGTVIGVSVAVASLYYAHSRIDHIQSNEKLDEILEGIDELLDEKWDKMNKEFDNLKNDIQALRKDIDDFKKK